MARNGELEFCGSEWPEGHGEMASNRFDVTTTTSVDLVLSWHWDEENEFHSTRNARASDPRLAMRESGVVFRVLLGPRGWNALPTSSNFRSVEYLLDLESSSASIRGIKKADKS